MSKVSPVGFIFIGGFGGLFGVISGLVMLLVGLGIRGNILLFILLYSLFPFFMQQLISYFQTIFFPIGLITIGPLGGYYLGNLLWDITTFGIVVSVHGFIILLSAFGAWTGNKWYVATLIIFGLIGTFALVNIGGLMGLISGVVLWYQLK